MTFGASQWLWGSLLIPALVALFIRAERYGIIRLREFVSARLLPQLAGTVNRPRRVLRFALQLLGLALAIASLAQPRWGYISEAITLATQSFGKSAVGNRALIIFTDGEELSGDAMKSAKMAADAGVRIFTIGVGTSEGSLIPIAGEEGGTSFVKDSSGQVVKSKLDEKRLREIAQSTGGFYLHLENGPRTIQQIHNKGLPKMQAPEFDVRSSPRPIERYERPLGAALTALALSILIGERKRARQRIHSFVPAKVAASAAALMICLCQFAFAAAPGLDAYREGKFNDAFSQFQQTLKTHPQSRAEDKLQFDSGAAAYKLKDYGKALESFSQALLSPDTGLQSRSHYNLGNTLYERA